MKAAQGKEEPFYSMFADFAEQAILVAGVMVAEQNGQREDSGRLRSNARDLALQNSKDALFLTEYAAWDVSNRYPSQPGICCTNTVKIFAWCSRSPTWNAVPAWDVQQVFLVLRIKE